MMENFTTIIKFILLGLIQGFTEPLPISSSGHSVLMKEFLNVSTPALSLEIVTHFGSLVAIMFLFRHDIFRLIDESRLFLFKKEKQFQKKFIYLCLLLLATTVTGIIGLYLEPIITNQLSAIIFVGMALIITGLLVWIIRHLNGNKYDEDVTIRDSLTIGIAQAFALLPGISRSGITVIAALLLGFERKTAIKFSFLLFIPVTAGTILLSINDFIHDEKIIALFIPYLLAFLSSIIATYFALKCFINLLTKGYIHIFTYYCDILGFFSVLKELL